MEPEPSRRGFLAAAGLLAAGAAAGADRKADPVADYPRDRPSPGGPLGSPTDRGKLVPGLRNPDDPPVPIEVPDAVKLPFKMVDGVKEFHLTAEPVKRDLLPDFWSQHWCFNGTLPCPAIEVTEGDHVRIIFHNDLPEPATLHLHGLELPIAMDGVPFLVQDPTPPGGISVYELTLIQTGTCFYHAHFPMQETIGMVGLFVIHPRKAWAPTVDQDFALLMQEFAIRPSSSSPGTTNYLTFNGRCGPDCTPLVVRLGNRVRIRIVNFSTFDRHPIHIHGHTFWVTGTEGGRIPDSAWMPGNNVLVAVAQARDFEFIANNPGDWVMHGPRSSAQRVGGRKPEDRPQTRGMRPYWYMGVHGLSTVVRVLPPDLYDKVISGKGDVEPGASVPGAKPAMMPEMKMSK